MKRSKKRKPLLTSLLAMSCIGILLTGCGADDRTAETPNIGQEITAADLQAPAHPPKQDTAEIPADDSPAEKEPAETPPPADAQDTLADTADLYEQFLYNGLAASVGKSYPQEDYRTQILDAGSSYTLAELGECISGYFLNPEYTDKTSYDYMQYAYVDCPDSPDTDKKNLLIKFVGLNIYSPDDDSYAVFVISENGGQLYVTYEYECWARSEDKANTNGILTHGGSGGAGDHYSGVSALLSDGSSVPIYLVETLSGWWTNYVNGTIYSEVFGEYTEMHLVVYIYTIGDDKYYWYSTEYCTEEEMPLCETFIGRCRDEAGINWATEDEIQALIRERCSALGIDHSAVEPQNEAVWNRL